MSAMTNRTAAVAAALAVPVMIGVAGPATAQTTPDTPAAAEATTSSSPDAVLAATGSGRQSARAMAPSRSQSPYRFASVKYNKWYAYHYMQYRYGWGKGQRRALATLWQHESGWNHRAHNGSSGAHGIPQALPGSKMSSAGPNWRRNPETQIKWGLSYIKSRYGSPKGAWHAWTSKGWY